MRALRGEFERDCRNLSLDARPVSKAPWCRVANRRLDGVSVDATHTGSESLRWAVEVVAEAVAADRVDSKDDGGLVSLNAANNCTGFGFTRRLVAAEHSTPPITTDPVFRWKVSVEVDLVGVSSFSECIPVWVDQRNDDPIRAALQRWVGREEVNEFFTEANALRFVTVETAEK